MTYNSNSSVKGRLKVLHAVVIHRFLHDTMDRDDSVVSSDEPS
jgi:hypothetical protein